MCENLSDFKPDCIQSLITTIIPSSSNFLGWLYGFQDNTRWKLIEGLIGDIGNIIRWGQSYDQLKIISIRRNLLTFFTEKMGNKSILYCIVFAINIESSIQSKGLRFFIEDNMIFMELMSDPLLAEIKIPIYTILMSLNILTLRDVMNLFDDVKSYDYMQPFFEKWPKYPSMIQETKKLWEEVTKNDQLAAIYDRYDLFERIIRQSFINVLSETDDEKIKCEMFALVVKEMLLRNKILQSPMETKKKRILTQTQRSDFHNCILNGPGEIQNQRTIGVASGLIRKIRSAVYTHLTEIEKKENFTEEEFQNDILNDTLRAIKLVKNDRGLSALHTRAGEASLMRRDPTRGILACQEKKTTVIHELMRNSQTTNSAVPSALNEINPSCIGILDLWSTPESNPGKRNDLTIGCHVYPNTESEICLPWIKEQIERAQKDEILIFRPVFINGAKFKDVPNAPKFLERFWCERVKNGFYFLPAWYETQKKQIHIITTGNHFAQLGIQIYNSVKHPDKFEKNEDKLIQTKLALTEEQFLDISNDLEALQKALSNGLLRWLLFWERNHELVALSFSDLKENPQTLYTIMIPEPCFTGLSVLLQPFFVHNAPTRVSYASCQAQSGIDSFRPSLDVEKKRSTLVGEQAPLGITIGNRLVQAGSVNIILASVSTKWTAEDGATGVNWGNHILSCYFEDVYVFEETYETRRVGKGFSVPDHTIRNSDYNYKLLDEHGIIPLNTIIENGDVLLEAHLYHNGTRDASIVYTGIQSAKIIWIKQANSINSHKKTIKIGIHSFLPLTAGNKITQTGNKSVISKMLSPFDVPITDNGIRIDIFNDPFSNPRRGLNGTGMNFGSSLPALFDEGSFEAWNSVPTDLTKMKRLSKEVWGNEKGRTKLYLPPYGEQMVGDCALDLTPIERIYKHGITEFLGANQHNTRFNIQKNCPERGQRRGGGTRSGYQERQSTIVHGDSKYFERCISDRDYLVFCKQCHISNNQSPYAFQIKKCPKCCSKDHLTLIQTSRNFLATSNLFRSRGIDFLPSSFNNI